MKIRNISIAILLALAAGGIAIWLLPATKQLTARFEPVLDNQSQPVTLVPNSIQNGNALQVTEGNQEIDVQLCGVAAFNSEQSEGVKARDHLRLLVERGDGQLILVPVATGQHGQMIAEVFVPLAYSVGEQKEQEIHLNAQLLLDGMAYIQPQDIESCPNASVMQAAEGTAKENGAGVWNSAVSQKH